ncbi:MAG: hypothetical protein U0401_18225 [Anaerolineae bacterium]
MPGADLRLHSGSPFDKLGGYGRTPTPTISTALASTAFTYACPYAPPPPSPSPPPADAHADRNQNSRPTRTPGPAKTAAPTVPRAHSPLSRRLTDPGSNHHPLKLAELYTQHTQGQYFIYYGGGAGRQRLDPGLRVVGIDPNGVVTASNLRPDRAIGNTPPGGVVKSGNAG